METARCEAVGARAMPGTAGNIDAKIADEARRQGFAELTDPGRAPLAQAAGYLVRHLATGRPLPAGAQNVMELWRGFLESNAGGTLEGLDGVLEDQRGFARLARQVIEDLGYGEQLGEDPDASDDEQEEEDGGDEAQDDPQARGSDSDESDEDAAAEDAPADERADPDTVQATLELAEDS
jgi:cobaltochelatase CobT